MNTKLNDNNLKNYLDKNFSQLIQREKSLHVENFFKIKWEFSEEIPIYHRYTHISFLDQFSLEEKNLYLLQYSLDHLTSLVNYFCTDGKDEEISKTLLMLTVSDWDCHFEDPLSFSFYICSNWPRDFAPYIKLAKRYTKESEYIVRLLSKLGLYNDYFVYDDLPSINKELQRVYVGLKKHPNPNLITLDNFVQNNN